MGGGGWCSAPQGLFEDLCDELHHIERWAGNVATSVDHELNALSSDFRELRTSVWKTDNTLRQWEKTRVA